MSRVPRSYEIIILYRVKMIHFSYSERNTYTCYVNTRKEIDLTVKCQVPLLKHDDGVTSYTRDSHVALDPIHDQLR